MFFRFFTGAFWFSILSNVCLGQAGVGKTLRHQVHPKTTNGNDNIEALIAEAESIKDNADAVLANSRVAEAALA